VAFFWPELFYFPVTLAVVAMINLLVYARWEYFTGAPTYTYFWYDEDEDDEDGANAGL
jgi:hypothetical protein